jgi:serine/threonine-protein kinase
MSTPADYSVGELIAGKYRLDRLLGEGGQACVWRAHNLMLDADVAIKVVRSDSKDPSHTRRLLQEAKAVARLGHPGIVRVFDLGETSTGDPFLVMELLEGETLADRLVVERQLSPEHALRLLLPVADALVSAHSKGLVHRDIKPENIFLSKSDDVVQPKLLDFGVVKIWQTQAETLTQSGAVVGTPAYFSPEQASGLEEIDERTDVWAFAATLYECLTGDLPFSGANYNALLRNIVESQPLTILDYGVGDAELWRIIQRGLAKPLHQRWSRMLYMGRALAQWLVAHGVAADVCGASLQTRWLHGHSAPGEPEAHTAQESPRHDPAENDAWRSATLLSGDAIARAPSRAIGPRQLLAAGAVVAAAAGGWFVLKDGEPAPAPASSSLPLAEAAREPAPVKSESAWTLPSQSPSASLSVSPAVPSAGVPSATPNATATAPSARPPTISVVPASGPPTSAPSKRTAPVTPGPPARGSAKPAEDALDLLDPY